jgi:hypothetical protein
MPQLTEQEWKRLEPLLHNIDINRQQAAYNRVVLGLTFVKAGEPFGYSRQDVAIMVKAVMKWWDKLNSLPDKPKPPPRWVAVEVFVPRRHADEVRRIVQALYPLPKPATLPAKKAPAKRRAASPAGNTKSR